jgi:chloride channel 3/4/5
VKTLRDQLLGLVANDDDGGFPILRQDDNGSRMVGYIGASELEHALSKTSFESVFSLVNRPCLLGIVADEADSPVFFHVISPFSHGNYGTTTTSVSSLVLSGEPGDVDPYDFSVYMDKAPLTVQTNSPLQLVQELFVKLGARYVIVTDTDGYCKCYLLMFSGAHMYRP